MVLLSVCGNAAAYLQELCVWKVSQVVHGYTACIDWKGKEEYLYSAILVCHTKRSGMDHTCKLHHACLSFVGIAFPS